MNRPENYRRNPVNQIVRVIVTLVAMAFIVYFFIGNMKQDAKENQLTIKNVVGTVEYIRGDKETILEEGSVVFCGGTFYTGEDSSATVIFDGARTVELLPGSTMEVTSQNDIGEKHNYGGYSTVKSYTVTLTTGEVIVDIQSKKDDGHFKVSTPEITYSAVGTKTDVRRQEEYGVTYINVDRGELEFTTGAQRTVKAGSSVYSEGDGVRPCATMTLEKKEAFVLSFIQNGTEEYYEVYSGDRASESNISYRGGTLEVRDLELVEQVYDILEKIYLEANKGETLIHATNLEGESITVHVIENNDGILTFDPIDFHDIYYSIMFRL